MILNKNIYTSASPMKDITLWLFTALMLACLYTSWHYFRDIEDHEWDSLTDQEQFLHIWLREDLGKCTLLVCWLVTSLGLAWCISSSR